MTSAYRAALAASLGFALATGPAIAGEPIKIGLVLPFSAGPFVAIANEIADSLTMAIDDAGGTVGGRKIELLREDTTHKPDVAQAKAKKLVF
jgi:branched-chain amino acid transport system substrate-binding protein